MGVLRILAGRFRVFISFASEDRRPADRLTTALRQEGMTVFNSNDGIGTSDDFDAKIHREISRCDLFVFLISEHSLSENRYTLTELQLARNRWPNPTGRVFPVRIASVAKDQLPGYLASVSIDDFRGDPIAAARIGIMRLRSGTIRRCWQRLVYYSLAVLLPVLLIGAAWNKPGIIPSVSHWAEPLFQWKTAPLSPPEASTADLTLPLVKIAVQRVPGPDPYTLIRAVLTIRSTSPAAPKPPPFSVALINRQDYPSLPERPMQVQPATGNGSGTVAVSWRLPYDMLLDSFAIKVSTPLVRTPALTPVKAGAQVEFAPLSWFVTATLAASLLLTAAVFRSRTGEWPWPTARHGTVLNWSERLFVILFTSVFVYGAAMFLIVPSILWGKVPVSVLALWPVGLTAAGALVLAMALLRVSDGILAAVAIRGRHAVELPALARSMTRLMVGLVLVLVVASCVTALAFPDYWTLYIPGQDECHRDLSTPYDNGNPDYTPPCAARPL